MKGTIAVIKTDGKIAISYHTSTPTLEQLQSWVGGFIERVPLFEHYGGVECVAFCNEEGKLDNLPLNKVATEAWSEAAGQSVGDVLVGDVVVISGDREFMKAL